MWFGIGLELLNVSFQILDSKLDQVSFGPVLFFVGDIGPVLAWL